jgi:hypothetical protein
MSIDAETRDQGLAAQRAYLARVGVPQIPAWRYEQEGGRAWTRWARCGQHNADAPDPELFFALFADSTDTYAAQAYCRECPVREVCDETATRAGWSGVWGGIYRDGHGRRSPLCTSIGCMSYRLPGRDMCTGCSRRAANAAEADVPAAVVTGPVREVVPV